MQLPFGNLIEYFSNIAGILTAIIPVVIGMVAWIWRRTRRRSAFQAAAHTVATPGTVHASYVTIPHPPGLVIGREKQLRLLKMRLGIGGFGRRTSEAVTVIHGFPGQGKTTIALALAYDKDVRQAFPGGVLWADLGENVQVDLHTELARWGDALDTPRVREASDLNEAIRRMRALLQGRHMLLIVDDVWEKEHGTIFARARGDCPIVITTRAAEIAEHLADDSNDRIRLPGLDPDAGLDLLGKLAPAVVQRFGAECRKLVVAVEGLPLALQVAGRLLREDNEQRLVDIRARIESLISGKLLEAEAPYQLVRETNNPTVAALLRRSITYLDAETRERFVMLGVFVAKPATFELADMAAVWATDDPVPTVKRLLDRGLLEPVSASSQRYQMHALLADLASAMLDDLY